MKQVRLVAYRNATTSATTLSSYELDMQETPNVSLNFQFDDIKEPEKRKASYSQTFKLPFTDNNNSFFQNWFNVNLTTLVFSARKKFNATLFVGATPQFEGIIQLKAVYQKAKLYEVVLMANTADLFTVIGEEKLQDIYRLSNGNYSEELNHNFTQANIIASWNGGADDFDNVDGTSLRDSSAGVQKVMYPMSLTKPNFYYNVDDPFYLNMTQADMENTAIFPDTYLDAQNKMVELTQLRPALQLKAVLNKLFLNAGFTYTSTFLDGSYFGKLFMTTCNHLGETALPVTNASSTIGGEMKVGNSASFGTFTIGVGNNIDPENVTQTVIADTVSGSECIYDLLNIWNEQFNYFQKQFNTMQSVQVKTKLSLTNVDNNNQANDIRWKVWLREVDANGVPTGALFGNPVIYEFLTPTTTYDAEITNQEFTLPLDQMGVGDRAQIQMTLENARAYSGDATIVYGNGQLTCANLYSKIAINWLPYNQGALNGEVNVPFCIDESILQKDFLLDIIQRFNLVVIADPDNPTNLIIEPYDDYLDSATIKLWTHKLDLSKEIVVKDTTSIQKKTLLFTDQEDVDLANKSIKENYEGTNVYGHYKRINDTNDFAQGEMKTKSIFSPYINERVFANQNTDLPTQLENMTVQYEFTYKQVENGYENPIEATKPKLFYYNGTATTVLGLDGNALTGGYNMHTQAVADGEIDVYNFTTYPVCTPFDVVPSGNVYTITQANKSLYWDDSPPLSGNLTVFNYNDETGSWFDNALYGLYWRNYLDSIYHPDARLMECYLNLNEVDIFNFKFNDEIFIKDTYWRVLNIENYQVGTKASTKVKLLKILDTTISSIDCDYVVGSLNGNNLWGGVFYYWCPSTNAGCTPVAPSGSDMTGIATTPECCTAVGGNTWEFVDLTSYGVGAGLFPCQYNDGSLPVRLRSLFGFRSLMGGGNMKNIFAEKLGTLQKPLVIGSDTGKFSQSILPYNADDFVIKYDTQRKKTPRLQGELHRIVMTGYTEGNTRGYAYPHGTNNSQTFSVPFNTNMLIRVNGIVTVVGGTSSTYTLGTTEGLAYYTAFKNVNGTITQLSTAGGQQEFSIREGANPTTCTLYITTSDGTLQFGLDDNQTDTKRIWSLSIEVSVQKLPNLVFPFGSKYALFQNAQNISFQNGDLLLWN